MNQLIKTLAEDTAIATGAFAQSTVVPKSRILRWVLTTGLAFCAAAAQAAGGFSITQSDEPRIAVGMNEAEVQQHLGPPARTRQYRGRPGPSWTYEVRGAPFGRTDFDIDFGADGKVVSTSERLYGSSH